MMFVESIKKGIDNAVRNWPAVLVQMGAMFIYGIGFVIMVVLPLVVVLGAVVGMDIQGLENILTSPANIIELIINNILGVLVAFIVLILYITLVFTMALFIFSGLLGVVGKASADPSYKFGFTAFMQEARRLFWRVVWLTFLLSLVLMGVLVVLTLMGVIGGLVLAPYYSSESLAAKFAAIFVTLLGISGALLAFVFFLAWCSYSLVAMVARDMKVVPAFQEGLGFIMREPGSMLFFLGAGGLYLLASIVVTLMVFPIGLIPIVGLFLGIPAQIVAYAVDRFLYLAVLGALFHYYLERNPPAQSEPTEAGPSGAYGQSGGPGDDVWETPPAMD